MRPKKLIVSLGVFAHNEEANIEAALKSIIASRNAEITLREIVVISSGSFDGTNTLIRGWQKRDKRIKLITQSMRQGKASAVNLFIRQATSPILVTMSADLVLSRLALDELCSPFWEAGVGMVGAHPVPRKVKGGLVNREIELLWQLHHEIAMIKPKCGEMVAFRNIIRGMPDESAVDEATLEVMLTIIGYAIRYAPRAIVYNKGAKNLGEFLKQRRRVQAGHEWVREKYNYVVTTLKWDHLFQVVFTHFWRRPQDTGVMLRLIMMEILARSLGFVDYYVLKRNPYKWVMIDR